LLLLLFAVICFFGSVAHADEDVEEEVEERGDAKFGFTDEEWEAVKETEESFEFQAEVSRLMDIIINALYSNRDIFLRELISNSADALDKIRFLSLSDSSLLGEGEQADLDIKISIDKESKTITLRDRGIGMTKADLIKNLGVVAKSGTTDFVEAAAQAGSDPLSLIGQFGVGFYSVYLVADRVTVVSKHNDDDQYIWESQADRTFSVARDPRGNTLGRGTAITLHLKEDAEEYLTEKSLETIAARYSQFVNFPIYLEKEETVSEEVPLDEEELAEQEAAREAAKEESEDDDLDVSDEEDEEEIPTTKTVKKQVKKFARLNDVAAIWTRRPSEVEEDEYTEFYKSFAKEDSSEPLSKIHFAAEGEISFRSILFIPKKAPADLYNTHYEKSLGLKLYVRRVLIADEFDDFLPKYLKFVKGIVDSDDLPLNVSRETLAQSRVLKVMSKKITRKVLEMLRKMAEAEEEYEESLEEDEDEDEAGDKEEDEQVEPYTKYTEFWKEYAKSIKLGVIEDKANKAKLTNLLRFPSTMSPDKAISLNAYIDGMKEDQRYIYYITGESQEAVINSPFLEKMKELDYEVLLLTEPLDEYVVQSLTEFEGNELMSVTKDGLQLGEDEDDSADYESHYEDFTTWFEGVLGDRVESVSVSPRLSKSPAVIVTGKYGWSANMERIMKGQTLSDGSKATYMHAKKTLEINPKHSLIVELRNRVKQDENDQSVKDLAELVYDAALVQSGFTMADSNDFASRIHRIVAAGLDTDPKGIVEDPDEYFVLEEEETAEDDEEIDLE
jgi:heat shock protein beta